jgi:hypothetical protein
MLDYGEKRSFPRMNLDCPASFSVAGEATQRGAIIKNLSGGGVLMWIDNGEVQQGAVLTIEVAPPNPLTPPMRAEVRVLRCLPVEDAEGQFAIGCAMQRVLD